MLTVTEPILDKIMNIPANQIPAFVAFLDSLTSVSDSKKDVSKRIGVAKDISFPADFDDIDYGTTDLFGLNAGNIC